MNAVEAPAVGGDGPHAVGGPSSPAPAAADHAATTAEGLAQHGADHHPDQHHHHPKPSKDSGVYPGPDGKPVEIKDVWASTLEREMAAIRDLVEAYPYVAMDTEFPGVVAKPIGDAYASGYQYQTLQCNVDLLKIIQLGISFCDGRGRTPDSGCYCFQFNFRFDLNEDMYAEDSIQLLKESGIDFARHAAEGIDVAKFGELVMMSGLVLREDVRWISFHSGYDFGYLIKILTCQTLPADEHGFFELLHIYFPVLYDVKLLMSCVDGLHGGLQRVAEDLKVERVGPMHQAGSDSMLTNATFFRLADLAFHGVDRIEDKYRGEIYGLGAHSYRGPSKHSGSVAQAVGGAGGRELGAPVAGTNNNNNNNNNATSNNSHNGGNAASVGGAAASGTTASAAHSVAAQASSAAGSSAAAAGTAAANGGGDVLGAKNPYAASSARGGSDSDASAIGLGLAGGLALIGARGLGSSHGGSQDDHGGGDPM